MSNYWWGLLTLPVIGLAWLLIVTFAGLLAKATAALPGTFQRITPDTDQRARASFGSIVYAATRCYWFGFGEVGFGLVVGQRPTERGEAFDRLYQKPTLRRLQRPSENDVGT